MPGLLGGAAWAGVRVRPCNLCDLRGEAGGMPHLQGGYRDTHPHLLSGSSLGRQGRGGEKLTAAAAAGGREGGEAGSGSGGGGDGECEAGSSSDCRGE